MTTILQHSTGQLASAVESRRLSGRTCTCSTSPPVEHARRLHTCKSSATQHAPRTGTVLCIDLIKWSSMRNCALSIVLLVAASVPASCLNQVWRKTCLDV